MNRKRYKAFMAKVGWCTLAFASALALIMMFADEGAKTVSGERERMERAFDAWCSSNGCSVRNRRYSGCTVVGNYGKLYDPDYSEYVEHALFCEDLKDYVGRSAVRRRWAYEKECEILDELLEKPHKTYGDTILIRKAVIRKDWYKTLLDAEIPDTLVRDVMLSAEEAWRAVDSIAAVPGLRITYRVKTEDGEKADFVFVSPADSIVLGFETVKNVDEK